MATKAQVDPPGNGIEVGVIYALEYAAMWEKWVVVIVPEGKEAKRARRIFASASPPGVQFSGRTAKVGKGRVSLVTADQEIFVEGPFSLLPLGEGSPEDQGNMRSWRKAAQETLSLGI